MQSLPQGFWGCNGSSLARQQQIQHAFPARQSAKCLWRGCAKATELIMQEKGTPEGDFIKAWTRAAAGLDSLLLSTAGSSSFWTSSSPC